MTMPRFAPAFAALSLAALAGLGACSRTEDRPPNNYDERAPDVTEPPTGTPNNSPTTGEPAPSPGAGDQKN